MKKQWKVLFVLALTLLFLAACNDEKDKKEDESSLGEITFPEFDKEKIANVEKIAEYQGGTVSGEEFATFLGVEGFMNPYAPINDAEYQNDSLKYFVMEKVIGAKVEDKSWAEERANSLWEEILETYDEKTREKAYKALKISEEDVKNYLVDFYTVQDYFRQDVTEEEIQKTYEDAKGLLTLATFRHILVKTQEMNYEKGEMEEIRTEEEAKAIIEEIEEKLANGSSLEELAKEYNEDPGSKDTSGLYEDAPVRDLEQNFAKAIMEQEIGEVGEPVKTVYGYHLIQVEDRTVRPLEEVRDGIIEQVAFEKSNDYLAMKVPGLINHVDKVLEVK
jgi:foldase protein PrsA